MGFYLTGKNVDNIEYNSFILLESIYGVNI